MRKISIYTDESVNIAIAEGLKRRGVDAFSARDLGKLGLTDEEQLIFAKDKGAAIFTHDADFLRLAVKWIDEGKSHHGIIYSSQKTHSVGECIRRLKILTAFLTPEDMINHIEFL